MTNMRRILAVATALTLAGAAAADMYLVARINLDSWFGAAGSNPIKVVSDGTYAYVAGMNNTPADRDIGVLKINLTNPADAVVLPGSVQNAQAWRYYDGLALHNGILYTLTDSPLGTTASTNVRALDAATGELLGSFDGDDGLGNGIVFQPCGLTNPATGGLGIDPGFGGIGGGLSLLAYGKGRRPLMDLIDGTTIYDAADGMIVADITGACTVPDLTVWRAHLWDAAGNLYARRSNQVQVSLRSGPNSISGYQHLTDALNNDGSPRTDCGDGKPVACRLATDIAGQNLALIPASSAATDQNLIVFNDNWTNTDPNRAFADVVKVITTAGALPSPAFRLLRGDGTPLTTAETPNTYGLYDFHYVAATDRLLVLDFLNRKLLVFGATPVVQPCPGDLDCDGTVNFDDIDRFVEALSYPGGAGWPHPECPWSNGDCNADGNVNFDDIDPFVARIGATCP